MVAKAIISRIGIPLAIAVGAGLILAKFRDPIIGAISKGAGTVGQALTQPIAGFFEGVGSGFANVPESINIKFPTFDFTQGIVTKELGSPDNPANDPKFPTQIDKTLSEGGTVPKVNDPNDPNNDPTKFLPPTAKPLPVQAPVFKVQTSEGKPAQFFTFTELQQKFFPKSSPEVINFIDFRNTEFRERIPVTNEGLRTILSQNKDAVFFLGTAKATSQIGSGLALDPNLV